MKKQLSIASIFVATAILFTIPLTANELPDPDGKPADMTQKVKVFIIMGQSNTLEMGKVKGDAEGSLEHAVKVEELYPFMVDDSGNWTVRKDVRNVHVMGSGGPGKTSVKRNDWLTVSGGKIGIETGIGHHLGNALDEPVLILKSSIGNRSLGWDLLPPGSPSYEFEMEVKNRETKQLEKTTFVFAGYGQSPDKWEKGTEPKPIGWKAGVQYDGDVARAKDVLKNLNDFYPDATGYEIVGFFWWQGDKDRYNTGHAAMYEKNLNNLIASLRKDFNAPKAKFVCATLGQTDKEKAEGNEKLIIDAMFAISNPQKYPVLEGDVATVYTNPLSMGGASNSHYGGNAKTYMNVALGMGKAMVELIKNE
ncbi:sialate O-acetylesterase [Aporhodopirellula aestuarii]|uniref:Sialate O-acetylesterase n=1 Tax=Aporhodopirellula aestuarii TaxID=2950107 RepID=A0ABT0U5M3_9BACT|nr:sialate O-acetylesterase [Aporhodopirellula aestuarii]MCM2372226.1 sialate O-acetylesterase [Aporhodopirellula aestuarii]